MAGLERNAAVIAPGYIEVREATGRTGLRRAIAFDRVLLQRSEKGPPQVSLFGLSDDPVVRGTFPFKIAQGCLTIPFGTLLEGFVEIITAVMLKVLKAVDELVGRHPVSAVADHDHDIISDAGLFCAGGIRCRDDGFREGGDQFLIFFQVMQVRRLRPVVPFIAAEGKAGSNAGEC